MTADGTTLRFHRRFRGARILRDGTVLYWWMDIICGVVFYLLYSAVRNANAGAPMRLTSSVIMYQSSPTATA